jgi:hypothetical protein
MNFSSYKVEYILSPTCAGISPQVRVTKMMQLLFCSY